MEIKKYFYGVLAAGVFLLISDLGCEENAGDRHFRRGRKAFGKQQYVRAKAEFEKSLNQRPGHREDNAVTYSYLGISYWQLKEFERAMDAFEQSRRLNPDLMEPHYNLGVLMYQRGQTDRAESLFKEAGLIDVIDPRPLEYLGHIYGQAENWMKARQAFSEALTRAPHLPRVLTALSMAELYVTGPDEAVSYLRQALSLNPNYSPALFNLAVIHHHWLQNQDQAKAFYQQYLNLASDDPHAEYARRAWNQLSAVTADREKTERQASSDQPSDQRQEGGSIRKSEQPPAFDDLLIAARNAYQQGNEQEALDLCLKAEKLAQQADDKTRRRKALYTAVQLCSQQADAHYAMGRFWLEENDFESALKYFRQARELNPESAPIHVALAAAATKIGDHDAALLSLQKTVQLNEESPDAWWSLASFYDRHLKKNQLALSTYQAFEQRFPDDPRVIKAQNRIKRLQSMIEEVKPYPEIFSLDNAPPNTSGWVRAEAPGSAPGLTFRKPPIKNREAAIQAYNRGTIYHQRQDWDRAIYYYTRALENDDRFVNAFYNLGLVYRAKGNLRLAKDAYIYALDLQPGMHNARYNLALIYFDLQQDAEALKQLKAVVQTQPNHAQAHYMMGLIYADNPQTHSQAKTSYQKFLALAPHDPSAPVARRWLQEH